MYLIYWFMSSMLLVVTMTFITASDIHSKNIEQINNLQGYWKVSSWYLKININN